MILNWAYFIVFTILAIVSLATFAINVVDYIKNNKGEHRFIYVVSTVIFILLAANGADKIF
jgi:hypothetical protein